MLDIRRYEMLRTAILATAEDLGYKISAMHVIDDIYDRPTKLVFEFEQQLPKRPASIDLTKVSVDHPVFLEG